MIIPAPRSEQSRSWCIALHLSGLLGICFLGFGQLLFPLLIWLFKRADDPAIDATGKVVLNFQLSYTIYFIIAVTLSLIIIGLLFFIPLIIPWIYLQIKAAMKMSNGTLSYYHYPWTINFLR